MRKTSRRNFIQNAAFAGLAANFLPIKNSFSAFSEATEIINLKQNAVILFQGDSITDGNRGRNEDPNHIMGHGYAFSTTTFSIEESAETR